MIKAANFFVLALNSSVSLPSLISTLVDSPGFSFPLSTFRFLLSTFHFRLALDRVHEGTFDVVEKDNANKQNRETEAGSVAEIDPVERAAAEIGVAEGLDDRRHWVCQDEPAEIAAANHCERIDDRRRIHHQLHSKADERE